MCSLRGDRSRAAAAGLGRSKTRRIWQLLPEKRVAGLPAIARSRDLDYIVAVALLEWRAGEQFSSAADGKGTPGRGST
jgi:hypothetical protein